MTLFCLVVSLVAIWWLLGHLGVWLKLGLSVLAPLVLVGAILAAEVVLTAVASPGRAKADGSMRGLVGCALFLALLALLVNNGRRIWPVPQYPVPVAEVELTSMANGGAKAKLASTLQVWQDKLEKLATAKVQFEKEKRSLLSKMATMGFRSSKDINNSKANQKIAEELLELQTQIKTLDIQQAKYKSAVEQIESALRRITRQERMEEAGVSNEDTNKLAQTAAELDERLQSGSDQSLVVKIELDSLLKETLGEEAGTAINNGQKNH